MEIDSGDLPTSSGGGSRCASPYLSLGTDEPSSLEAGGGGVGATHYPSHSSSSSSSSSSTPTGWRRPASVFLSTRNVMHQILSSSRGGLECPFPPLFDEEHPDPCECLCNFIRMPRVPSARHHYLLYRAPDDGRIYTIGPHWGGVVFTVGLVLVASFLFIRNVAFPLGPGYVLTASIYTLLTLLTLLRTACLDPGFITRSAPETLPRRKYCQVCQLYTSPAAGHCEDCGICIEGLDHHCPWMGHCVGRNNMGAFLCFNCVWLTYVLFVLGCLAVQGGLFGPLAAGGGAAGVV